jgi:putative glutamine amidotransferase
VEAVWDPAARFCLGVQWHPEVLTHRSDHAPLFASLVAAACGVAPVLALAV